VGVLAMHHQLIKKGHEDRIKKTTFEALSRDFWNRIKIYDVKSETVHHFIKQLA
jgi:hypothetical protein